MHGRARVDAGVDRRKAAERAAKSQAELDDFGGALTPQHHAVADALYDFRAVIGGDRGSLGRKPHGELGSRFVPPNLRQPRIAGNVREEECLVLFHHSVT